MRIRSASCEETSVEAVRSQIKSEQRRIQLDLGVPKDQRSVPWKDVLPATQPYIRYNLSRSLWKWLANMFRLLWIFDCRIQFYVQSCDEYRYTASIVSPTAENVSDQPGPEHP